MRLLFVKDWELVFGKFYDLQKYYFIPKPVRQSLALLTNYTMI